MPRNPSADPLPVNQDDPWRSDRKACNGRCEAGSIRAVDLPSPLLNARQSIVELGSGADATRQHKQQGVVYALEGKSQRSPR